MCCYCGGSPAYSEDHLITMNRTALGLEAWGNVVPACAACNSKKHGRDWRDFIIQRAGDQAAERHARMHEFFAKYPYAPKLDLRRPATVEELEKLTAAMRGSWGLTRRRRRSPAIPSAAGDRKQRSVPIQPCSDSELRSCPGPDARPDRQHLY